MSIFYLLPPRPAVNDRLAGCLAPLLPGLGCGSGHAGQFADLLLETLAAEGVYLVCRDDLTPGTSVEQALADGFGAEPGDEVVEIWLGPRPGDVQSRRWRVGHRCRQTA